MALTIQNLEEKYGNFYVPAFKVLVDGKDLLSHYFMEIASVQVDNTLQGADRFSGRRFLPRGRRLAPAQRYPAADRHRAGRPHLVVLAHPGRGGRGGGVEPRLSAPHPGRSGGNDSPRSDSRRRTGGPRAAPVSNAGRLARYGVKPWAAFVRRSHNPGLAVSQHRFSERARCYLRVT